MKSLLKYIRILIIFILLVVLFAPPFNFLKKREKTITPIYFIDTSATMAHSTKKSVTDSIVAALSQKNTDFHLFDGANWPKNFDRSEIAFKLPVFITDGFIENSVIQLIEDKNGAVHLVGEKTDESKTFASLTLEPDNSIKVQVKDETVRTNDTLLIIVNQNDSFKTTIITPFLLPAKRFRHGVNNIDLHIRNKSESHVFYNSQKRQNIIYSPSLTMDTRFWISLFKEIDPKIEVVNSSKKFIEKTSAKKFNTVVFIYPDRHFEKLEYDHAVYVLYDFVPNNLNEILTPSKTKITTEIFNAPPIQYAINIKQGADIKNLAATQQPIFFRWQNNTVFLGKNIHRTDLFLVLVRRGLPKVSQTIKSATSHFLNSPSFVIHNTAELFTTGIFSGRAVWNNFDNFFVSVLNGKTETVIENFSANGDFSQYIPPQRDTLAISAIFNNNRFEPFLLLNNENAEPKPIAHANKNVAINNARLTDDPLSFANYRRDISYNQRIQIILDENKVVLFILLALFSLVWVGEFVMKKRA